METNKNIICYLFIDRIKLIKSLTWNPQLLIWFLCSIRWINWNQKLKLKIFFFVDILTFLYTLNREDKKTFLPKWCLFQRSHYIAAHSIPKFKKKAWQNTFKRACLTSAQIVYGWGFLTSQWDRQLKLSANAGGRISWNLSKFQLF